MLHQLLLGDNVLLSEMFAGPVHVCGGGVGWMGVATLALYGGPGLCSKLVSPLDQCGL